MTLDILAQVVGLTVTLLTIIGGAVWGYSRLNFKVETTKLHLEKHDSKTAEAIEKINTRIDNERARADERDDMLRNSLQNLHIEVLKALPKENRE